MNGEKFVRATALWLTISALGILLFNVLSELHPAGSNPVSVGVFSAVWVGLSMRWGYLLGRMD